MKRFLARFLVLSLGLSTLAAGCGGYAWEKWVVEDPGDGFDRASILAIIAQESPVYYRDGVTPLGVFFDQEHRRYVPYAELPTDWVHAIVAAEDGSFFSHPGVNPKHVVRAMWQNARAGHVVAGGSTLTQQTAKNLFYRPDRSFRSKWTELVNAMRLESHFSKEDILEFYANQFHVSANGRGLGIAARYFFDKEPAQLTTKECAFIAGMVKSPATYNPFLGESPERRDAARQAAEDRTAYVLRRMVEEGYLDEATRAQLVADPLVFRRGAFQYDRSVVIDEVQRELERPAFVELFERLGIENPSTAGIQVVTTLDPVAQREATWALWHHLTELGASLEGGAAARARLPELTAMPMAPGVPLQAHEVVAARVTWSEAGMVLDAGGRPCAVDEAAQARALGLLGKASAGKPFAEAWGAILPERSYVLASVREVGPEGPRCDIEVRPELQGASVVLEEGQVRALVGGNTNRNFDRVNTAKRQFGSTWKPLVYEAALHLGWLPSDVLDNRRNVFPWREVWYYPHPDHRSDDWLPMTAVGARSENLASVWLLYHLTDRLNAEQLRRLAELVGLAPTDGEDREAWVSRMRDAEGLRSSQERYAEYAFTLARQDVASGLAFSAHPEDALALRSLLFGRGFAAERARLLATTSTSERDARLRALDASLVGLEELAARCLAGESAVLSRDPATGAVACGSRPAGFEPFPADLPNGWVAIPLMPEGDGARVIDPANQADLAAVAEAWLARTPIGGLLHLSTLRELRSATDRRAGELAGRDPWDPEVVALNPDYRVLVGVRYLVRLVGAFGVETELPSVLSLPLGAADVTLMDMAVLYQGMLRGERFQVDATGFEAGGVAGLRSSFVLPATADVVSLIAEVRDSGGNVLYRATPRRTQVADPAAGAMVGDILRSVVRSGTGRRAENAVEVRGAAVPLAGKTGTTNDYRNAAFVGAVPRMTADGPVWGDGYTVATYVGYDDNRSMRAGSLRVQGASGALPAWLGVVRGLAGAGMLGSGGGAEYVPGPSFSRVEVLPGAEGRAPLTALVPASGERMFAPFSEPPAAAGSEPALTAPDAVIAAPVTEVEDPPAAASPGGR